MILHEMTLDNFRQFRGKHTLSCPGGKGIGCNELGRFSTNPPTLLLLLPSFIYNPLGKGA